VLVVLDFQPRSFSADLYAMLANGAEIAVRELDREQVGQRVVGCCTGWPMN
jgi:hypothetical protein